ncbi:MAG: PQQ-binding-like beta-propeller repeat protein [Phycisphaeraceae bacterium]
MRKSSLYFSIALLLALAATSAAADWPTYRGSNTRRGNIDSQPGPASAKVLWVHHSKDDFFASLSAREGTVYATGLGGIGDFNVYALVTDPASTKRAVRIAGSPLIKQPVLSSPSIAGDYLIFGDGMHLNSGAVLRCLTLDGFPVWQLTVPGTLVHMEGSPVIDGNRVYIGGGHAGVMCIDADALELEGKSMTRAQALVLLKARWADMLADYERRKKVDEFAFPPLHDALPKPQPKVIWQVGKNAWHVDAPLALEGERLLVSSSLLDAEKQGKRSLLCLKTSDGSLLWETPMPSNPWGGASIVGDRAYIGCSTVGMYPQLIAAARGDVMAINLKDGSVAWKKPVKGGVVSPIAVTSNLAIFTATDGKVRAFDVNTGLLKWLYDGGAPFYAGAAVAGDFVYTGDLRGIVHAIHLANGTGAWKLDLAADPTVKLSQGGKIYGSPIVHGGRLFVATCNLERDGTTKHQMAIVCIGEK